jgi:hypothetical protein
MVSNKKRGTQSEKRGVKKYRNSKLTINSGALWFAKGDFASNVKCGNYTGLLFENKITGKKAYTLKEADLDKIKNEALLDDRMPVFRIEFPSETYITIPEWMFLEILERVTVSEEKILYLENKLKEGT